MAEYGALATLDVDSALSEIATGILSKQIAARWNVNPKTLRDKLKRADPDGYASAIEAQTDAIVEDATQYAIECADKDDAPIARVRLDGAYRYAKAKNPAVYGDKIEVTTSPLVVLHFGLGATMGATAIDGDAKLVTDQEDSA